jgi:hypothetical protein
MFEQRASLGRIDAMTRRQRREMEVGHGVSSWWLIEM